MCSCISLSLSSRHIPSSSNQTRQISNPRSFYFYSQVKDILLSGSLSIKFGRHRLLFVRFPSVEQLCRRRRPVGTEQTSSISTCLVSTTTLSAPFKNLMVTRPDKSTTPTWLRCPALGSAPAWRDSMAAMPPTSRTMRRPG